MERQKLEIDGDEVRLTNTYLTDPHERFNAEVLKGAGKGFVRDERGRLRARLALMIPLEDAARLRAQCDIDWIAWEECGDRNALRRLLARHPYWQASEGRF